MLIATFGPSTGWLGRTIVFENNVFVLQDHGPISPSDVMLYDQQGQLVWVNDEMRAYVAGCAQATAVPAPVTTVQAGTPLTSQPTARSATPKNKATAPMHQSVNKWHLILIAIVVAIGLVLMLLARQQEFQCGQHHTLDCGLHEPGGLPHTRAQ